VFKAQRACPAHSEAPTQGQLAEAGVLTTPQWLLPGRYTHPPQIQGGLSLPSPAAGHDGNLSKRNAGAALGSTVTGWPPLL